jgi:cytochrome c biogenesis protein CcmG/thiol:disulfide interchange protein DsbE
MLTPRAIVFIGTILSICVSALAEPAPSFTLPAYRGAVSLDSLRGRVVYLDFWASWCDPCRKSFPWMEDMQKKYGAKGLTVVAVNLDSKQENADKFLDNHPASFHVAFDPAGKVAKSYKVKGMPSSYLIDRAGQIVESHIGFREKEAAPLEKKIVELLEK